MNNDKLDPNRHLPAVAEKDAATHSKRSDVVSLAWILENGERHRVSDYASLAPSARPTVSCPICHDTVTLKLGSRVTHHAAHRPGVDCAATNPETALHLNVKLHIAEELEKADALLVRQDCANRNRHGCAEVHEFAFARNWTDVRVEMTVGSRRPDITLLHNGEAFAAIEVAVTHLVDAEKSVDLESHGLQWIEVRATPELYAEGVPWTAHEPLVASRIGGMEGWECPACTRDRREEEFAARNGPHVRHRRVVDFFYPSGKSWREVYETVAELVDGEVVAMVLCNRSSTIFRVEGPLTDDAKLALKTAFQAHVRQHAAKCRAECCCATDWEPVNANESAMHLSYRLSVLPFRFKWSTRNQRWFESKEWRQSR